VDPGRSVVVCRELTKRFEEVVHGTAAELASRFERPARGEITVVIGPATAAPAGGDDAAAVVAVAELTAAGAPRRVAADVVARLTGVSRNRLYRRSL
jgi:16S rRNA (cytidine1402-2'-O)-methyltransferase